MRSYRWQNLTNQPLEALKELVLLSSIAYLRIAFSSVRMPCLIFAKISSSIWLSVGLPPPYFRSQPFFFQRRRFRRGIPDYLEMSLTSSPAKIYLSLKVLCRLLPFFLQGYISCMVLEFYDRFFLSWRTLNRRKCCCWFRKVWRVHGSVPFPGDTCRRWTRFPVP